MRQIAVADVGGTHARFALAKIDNGRVLSVGEPVKLHTSEHGSFQLAWQEFGRREGIELPTELAIAFAGPVGGDVLKLTNNPWVIRPAAVPYTSANSSSPKSSSISVLSSISTSIVLPLKVRCFRPIAETAETLLTEPRMPVIWWTV